MADAHATHDLLAVAEAADRGGRLPTDLAACPDCRALLADLVAIAAAVPTAALPTRPRAYILTATDAARLHRGGWRRWLGAIGSSRDAVTRPLALGFTTLGLAGLLFATIPGTLSGDAASPASAPEYDAAQRQQVAPVASEAPAAGGPDIVGEGASGPPAMAPSSGPTEVVDGPGSTKDARGGAASFPLGLLSGLLLALGIGLFVLRRMGAARALRP